MPTVDLLYTQDVSDYCVELGFWRERGNAVVDMQMSAEP